MCSAKSMFSAQGSCLVCSVDIKVTQGSNAPVDHGEHKDKHWDNLLFQKYYQIRQQIFQNCIQPVVLAQNSTFEETLNDRNCLGMNGDGEDTFFSDGRTEFT